MLDNNDFSTHKKYNITSSDFTVLQDVFTYLEKYADEYKGSLPSYEVLEDKFDSFTFKKNVSDSFISLIKEIKSCTAKRKAYELLQSKVSSKFDELDGKSFIEWLDNEVTSIKENVEVDTTTQQDWSNNGEDRFNAYLKAKNGERIVIPTPYQTLTNFLEGGFELGDYVLLQAYTNVGKSWIASHIGLSAWENGFDVLHYSPELSRKQQNERLDSIKGSFSASELARGKVNEEAKLEEYFQQFKNNSNKYIIKSMEDIEDSLDLKLLESDLIRYPDTKMLIIDGFNLLAHKGTGSNRDKMSATSRQLRKLFAKHNVVGIVVHQTPTSARKENEEINDVGDRLPAPAKIHQYSETIAVVQDACTVLSFDASKGLGKILIAKARKPCVGEEVDLIIDYSRGSIQDKMYIAKTIDFGF